MNPNKKLAEWMRDCMAQNNWTAEEWARLAKTSATNITRFISEQKHTPSGRVLDRLAGVAHIPLPLGEQGGFQISGRSIPVVKGAKTVAQIEKLREKTSDKIITLEPVGKFAFAVQIKSDRMSMGGILPDDVVVVEPVKVKKPKQNDVIVFTTAESGVEAGRWFPPFLMPQSTNTDHDPVKITSVNVLGVAIQQIRTFE